LLGLAWSVRRCELAEATNIPTSPSRLSR
jgi:hypothetical protein